MTRSESSEVPARAKELLEIFLEDPQMVDTVEGIARWRVLQQRVTYTVNQVSEALTWLAEQGFLVREEAAGAGLFKLNVRRVPEARQFVRNGWGLRRATATFPGLDSPMTPLVIRWLDAMLLRYWRSHGPRDGDYPGLTRGQASIEALLLPPETSGTTDQADAERAAEDARRELLTALDDADEVEPLALLYQGLGLTITEWQALLLCLAPEIDSKYQVVYGVFNDEMGRRSATLGLICAILGDPLEVRAQLAASDGLIRWRLIDHPGTLPHADEPLRPDVVLVSWLVGQPDALETDPHLEAILRREPWIGETWLGSTDDRAAVDRLARKLAGERKNAWIILTGEDTDGWRALLEAAAREIGLPLLRISSSLLATAAPPDARESVARIVRLMLLARAVVAIDAEVDPEPEASFDGVTELVRVLGDVGRPGVLIAPELERMLGALPQRDCDVLHRDTPTGPVLSRAYAAAAAEAGIYLGTMDAERLALAFPMRLSDIDKAVRLATLQSAQHEPISLQAVALSNACRRVASPDVPRFARRMVPAFGLDDVVLPPDRRAQLDEMVAHVRYACQVLNTWGFGAQLPYGRGVAALFCGPSGTGKSMAAQAIACELHTEAYVLDLSRVVSKYIGDSEKHIDMAFRDAQRAGAVLQIDEAEAMFGKRSEIKDAHDRYANIEVAYLLQRMEAFDGVAILTTNLRQNLDQAFLRRLRFIVEFPKPDAEAREAIWRRCLPKTAPFRDVNLRSLARRLELTGGNIRQITVRAAFLAASEQSATIEMRHVVSATRAELLKLGMPGAERELAEFVASPAGNGARVA